MFNPRIFHSLFMQSVTFVLQPTNGKHIVCVEYVILVCHLQKKGFILTLVCFCTAMYLCYLPACYLFVPVCIRLLPYVSRMYST